MFVLNVGSYFETAPILPTVNAASNVQICIGIDQKSLVLVHKYASRKECTSTRDSQWCQTQLSTTTRTRWTGCPERSDQWFHTTKRARTSAQIGEPTTRRKTRYHCADLSDS